MQPSRPIQANELCAHADFLQRLARGLLGDPQRAEDAVQDAFLTALEHPPRDGSAPGAWLARVTRNRAFNLGRTERRRAEHERRAAIPERHEGEEHVLERLELQRFVSEAVLALDEPRRTAVYLRYYEGLMPREIAARMGTPVKTVKSHLHRALAELRERLDARCGGDRRAWALALLPLVRPASIAPGAGVARLARGLSLTAACGVLAFFAWRLTAGNSASDGALARGPEDASAVAVRAAVVSASPTPPVPARQPLTTATSAAALEIHLRWEKDGAPAAGVGLDALAANDPAPRETRARTTTDAAGVARFTALLPGPVELRLDRAATFTAEAVAGETRTVELVVPAGVDVAGRVVSASGQPVAGAELWLEDLLARLPEPWPAGRSAADGTFHLRSLSMRQTLVARSPAFQPSQCCKLYQFRPDSQGQLFTELVLEEGGQRLDGRVLAPDGAAVPDAIVWIGANTKTSVVTSKGAVVDAAGSAWTTTDAAGRFSCPNLLAPGDHDLIVLAPGFPTWKGEVEVLEEPATIAVTLAASRTITGVVAAASGEPVPGARIRALAASGDRIVFGDVPFFADAHRLPPLHATTDASGAFTLGWLGSGAVQLESELPARPELGRARLVVQPASAASCALVLDPDPRIEGRAVDAGGHALAGWHIEAVPASIGLELRNAETDADGRFALYGLEDRTYRVHATAPGVGVQPKGMVNAAVGTVDLEIVIAAQPISLRVRGALREIDGSVPTTAEGLLLALDANVGLRLRPAPDTGAFEATPGVSGRYVVQAKRGQRIVAVGAPFELAAGADFDAGTLVIPVPGELEVTLASEPEAVGLRLERPGFGHANLQPEGDAWRAGELAPGTWWLEATAVDSFAPGREVEIRSGEKATLALAFQPATTQLVTLALDEAARLATDLELEVRDALGTIVLRRSQAHGFQPWPEQWTLRLPPGEFVVEARTSAGLRATASVLVGSSTGEALALSLR